MSPGELFGSVAVSGKRPDGLFHVAVVEHKAGTHWMKPLLRVLLSERGNRLVGERTGPAAAVVQDLLDDGLMSEKDVITSRVYAQTCAEFFNAVAERLVRYPVPQPDLDAALASARTTPLEGAWKWSRNFDERGHFTVDRCHACFGWRATEEGAIASDQSGGLSVGGGMLGGSRRQVQ